MVSAFASYDAEVEFTGKVPSLYAVPPKGERAIRVGISAVGGGTVGKAYANQTWIWGVWSRGRLVASGDDLRSGAFAATHAEMASTLCAFLAQAGEEAAAYPSRNHAVAAAEHQRAEVSALAYGMGAWKVLTEEHERFSACAWEEFEW
jgi:hypothetical protein